MCKFSLLCFVVALGAMCIISTKAEDDEIKIEILTPPPADCERKTKKFDQLSMHYTGTLSATGEKFDSSFDRKEPFTFQLGTGQVIRGWDEGLLDMCVGEKRLLKIPSSKGYGEQGAGDKIPGNSDLTFEAELMAIQDGVPPPNLFKEIDVDGDKLLSQEEVSNYLKKQMEKAGDAAGADDDQHKEVLTQIFNHEDKDKDGFISHEEFSGPKHDEL